MYRTLILNSELSSRVPHRYLSCQEPWKGVRDPVTDKLGAELFRHLRLSWWPGGDTRTGFLCAKLFRHMHLLWPGGDRILCVKLFRHLESARVAGWLNRFFVR